MIAYLRQWREQWAPCGYELVLAMVSTGWWVLLFINEPESASAPVATSIVRSLGGIVVFHVILGILLVAQWAALLWPGWSDRWRGAVVFAVFLWWVFVSCMAALTNPTTPWWTATAGHAGMAFLTWRAWKLEAVRTAAAAGGSQWTTRPSRR